jgi:P pilus assembly chaperone PapD
MPKIKFTFKFALVATGLFFLCVCANLSLQAQGDLMVYPKRVVFEGSVKTSELNLANTGNDTARYNISIMQYRMNEDGSFTEIKVPDEGQNFADKFLRFYPRSVILGPKESQTIKVQLTKTNLLTPGEYRSHIYFRAIPNAKPLGDEEKKDTTSLSIRLIPIFGITIPVIIKVGDSDAKVTLSDLNFTIQNDTIPLLQVKMNRTGNMSVYGELSATYHSTSGKTTVVGKASGIAVYTPIPARKFQLSLIRNSKIDYHSGSLHVEYTSPSDTKPMKFAEADLQLK